MKLSIALSSLLILLPLLTEAASVPSSASLSARQNRGNFFNRQRQRQRQGQNRGQQQNQNNNNKGGAAAGGAAAGGAANGNNNNKGGAAAGGAAAGGAAAGGAAGGAAAGGAAAGGAANNGTAAAGGAAAGGAAANNNGATADLQTSLCLDPKLINVGSENDGQDVPTDGQVASATSVNNFINFCDGQTLTNGQQVEAGSCNGIPMGKIVPKAKMPSAKFVFPKNLDVIAPNKQFTIQMAINNLQTGNFVNAQANYFSAPADLNGQQILIGHSHVTVEEIGSLTNTKPLDPTVFAFFKGLNAAAVNGVLTADVTNGLPAGTYRMCSINSAANHQPALVAIAQHGSLDDCSYFVASDQGVGTNLADVAAAAANNGGAAAGGAAAGGAAAGGAAAGGAANGNNNNNGGAAAGGAAAGGAAAGGAAAGGAANGNNNGKNNGGAAAGGAAAGGAAAGGAAAGGAANGNNNGKNNGGAAAGGAAAGGAAAGGAAAGGAAAGGKNNGGAAAGGAAAGGAAAGGKNNGAAAGGAAAGGAAGGAAANNGGPLKLNGANGGQVNIAKPGLVPPQTAAQTNGQNRGQQQQGQQRGQQQRGPFGGFGGRNGRSRFA